MEAPALHSILLVLECLLLQDECSDAAARLSSSPFLALLCVCDCLYEVLHFLSDDLQQIIEGYDADQHVFFRYDGHTPDPALAHDAQDLIDGIAGAGSDRIGGHDVGYAQALWVKIARHCNNGDVAVSNDAYDNPADVRP